MAVSMAKKFCFWLKRVSNIVHYDANIKDYLLLLVRNRVKMNLTEHPDDSKKASYIGVSYGIIRNLMAFA